MSLRLKLRAFAFLFLAVGCAALAPAAAPGTDNAANSAYASGWTEGTNGNPATFGAWHLSATSSMDGAAGFYRGDSTNLAGNNHGADINAYAGSDAYSFGMYGQPNTGTAEADAFRSLTAPLSPGQSFSLDIAVNFRSGNKGVDIRDSSGTAIFNLNVGGDTYVVNDAVSGNGSLDSNNYDQNTAFHIVLLQTSGTGGTFEVDRLGGRTGVVASGTFAGIADSLKLYVFGTESGSTNDFFANNLVVAPEPGALAITGLMPLIMLRRRGSR